MAEPKFLQLACLPPAIPARAGKIWGIHMVERYRIWLTSALSRLDFGVGVADCVFDVTCMNAIVTVISQVTYQPVRVRERPA